MIYGLGLLFVLTSWLTPGHYFPWTSFQQEVLACIGVGLVALAALVMPSPWASRVPAMAIGAAALATVPIAQYLTGQIIFRSDAMLSSAYLLGFALAIEVGRQLRVGTGQSITLASFGAFIAASLISTGIGMVQWLQLGPMSFIEYVGPLERISANMRQPNQLASLLGIGIVAILWLYEDRRIRGLVASISLSVIGSCLVMTQSRTGWLFVAGFGVIWLFCRNRLQLRAPVAAVLLSVSVFFAAVVGFGEINHWFGISESVSIADRLQPGRRGAIWAAMLDAAWRSPWFGYGWQQIPLAQHAVAQDHTPINYWLTSSHNIFLDLALWNGIPIALGVGALCTWWLVSRVRRCRDVETAALLAALGVLGVHSTLELPLHYAYYLLPAGLMVGIIEGIGTSARPVDPAPRAWRFLAACAWVFSSILTGWVVVDYLKVEEATRRAGLRDVGVIMGSAPAETPDVWLLDGPREFIHMWLSTAREDMPPAELDWMRSVSHRYPVAPAMFRYALAAGLNGKKSEAIGTLDLLCRSSAKDRCLEAERNWSKAKEKFPRLIAMEFPVHQYAADSRNK